MVIHNHIEHVISMGFSLLSCCHAQWWENDEKKMIDKEIISNMILIFGEILLKCFVFRVLDYDVTVEKHVEKHVVDLVVLLK